jgi:hypothetical protein
MQQQGVQPNSVTFVGVPNACASLIALEEGRSVHHHIIQSGLKMNPYFSTSRSLPYLPQWVLIIINNAEVPSASFFPDCLLAQPR